jgi:[acyl-carrier-protein] S-malonyltransferase
MRKHETRKLNRADVALLFVGQGSQTAGMLDDELCVAPEARDFLARADERLNFPLSKMMRAGDTNALFDTTLAQPALLTIGVLHAWHLRQQGVEPCVVVGHSVGQFAALVAAGALDFESALDLVRARARLMAAAMPPEGGAMAAILGSERAAVYDACRKARSLGVVGVACHNAPDQTVISGVRAAVEAVMEALAAHGMRVVPLAVSIATHSDLLVPVVESFAPLVAKCPVTDPRTLVIDNVTARRLPDAAAVRRSMLLQLVAPVLFEESINKVRALGVTSFIQCGPGDVLLRCVRRQFPESACTAFHDVFAGAAAVA